MVLPITARMRQSTSMVGNGAIGATGCLSLCQLARLISKTPLIIICVQNVPGILPIPTVLKSTKSKVIISAPNATLISWTKMLSHRYECSLLIYHPAKTELFEAQTQSLTPKHRVLGVRSTILRVRRHDTSSGSRNLSEPSRRDPYQQLDALRLLLPPIQKSWVWGQFSMPDL
jgi:hypothetical protein